MPWKIAKFKIHQYYALAHYAAALTIAKLKICQMHSDDWFANFKLILAKV